MPGFRSKLILTSLRPGRNQSASSKDPRFRARTLEASLALQRLDLALQVHSHLLNKPSTFTRDAHPQTWINTSELATTLPPAYLGRMALSFHLKIKTVSIFRPFRTSTTWCKWLISKELTRISHRCPKPQRLQILRWHWRLNSFHPKIAGLLPGASKLH